MNRAAIIIGVDKTGGGMPKLKDAAKGARRFEAWAKAQKFETIRVFTDEGGEPVEIGKIKRALKEILDQGTAEQLIIYFAGHGINKGYSEYWLLSDAPSDSSAAVNVKGSAEQAFNSSMPHTIFVSDACRTAAGGDQLLRLEGSLIFPTDVVNGLEKSVDLFYACTLGRPAHEVRDPEEAAASFSALYTDAFLESLSGQQPDLLRWTLEDDQQVAYVRPRPLKPHLTAEIPRRIKRLNLQNKVIQIPDARIVSDDNAWLARLTEEDGLLPPSVVRSGNLEVATSETSEPQLSALLVEAVLKNPNVSLEENLVAAKLNNKTLKAMEAAPEVIAMAREVATPFGVKHQETQCGFKVRGAKFIEALGSGEAQAELLSSQSTGEVVRMHHVPKPGASVLLKLDNGTAALLPAIPGFLAGLTVEDGELVDVSYEPSDNTDRWPEYERRSEEIRGLRAIAAASTRSGVFSLSGDDALKIAQQMQYLKGVDPSLAVYAAYAYYELRRQDLIKEMSAYMIVDLGARLFDIALLSRDLRGEVIEGQTAQALLSPFPLLSQGWALLAAQEVKLPPSLQGIQQSLLPSVWTLFNEEGSLKIATAIQKNEIP